MPNIMISKYQDISFNENKRNFDLIPYLRATLDRISTFLIELRRMIYRLEMDVCTIYCSKEGRS